MGGDREDTIESAKGESAKKNAERSKGVLLQDPVVKKADDQGLNPIGPPAQKIRFHESGQEVHFHADVDGLKVAVPSDKWWNAWNDLSSLRSTTWSFIDIKRKTKVNVEIGTINNEIEARIEVSRVELPQTFGDVFNKLDKFTKGK